MIKTITLFMLILLIPSGSHARYTQAQDGAPVTVPSLSQVKDAVPKWEPLSRFGNAPSYKIDGQEYELINDVNGFKQRGVASWYGTKFHRQMTSSGEPYDMFKMTAAHKTLPIPSYARVTNLQNGKQIVVKINDRGPFHSKRIVDLSYAAASKLGITQSGTAQVELEVLGLSDRLEKARLYLQIGAFSLEKNAKKLATQITTLIHHPVAIRRHQEGSQAIYRVQIGPIAQNRLFSDLKNKLLAAGLGRAMAVVE